MGRGGKERGGQWREGKGEKGKEGREGEERPYAPPVANFWLRHWHECLIYTENNFSRTSK